MSQDRSLAIFAAVGCTAFATLLLCTVGGGVAYFFVRGQQPAAPLAERPSPEPVEHWGEPIVDPGSAPSTEPTVIMVEHLTIGATVNSFSGPATVTAGSACNFDVEHRIFSNNTAQCHVEVVCGNNVHLYGTSSNGFFRCEFSRVPARVVGQDLETTSGDTDGAFVIDTDRHVLEVRDDAQGAYGMFDMRATITSVL